MTVLKVSYSYLVADLIRFWLVGRCPDFCVRASFRDMFAHAA